jgi:hypothetical protein
VLDLRTELDKIIQAQQKEDERIRSQFSNESEDNIQQSDSTQISEQQQYEAYQAQLREQEKRRQEYKISQARKQRESEKYNSLTNRRVITSEDSYQELSKGSGVSDVPLQDVWK